MFNKLTEFSYKRNFKEAVGFYVAYLILIIIMGMLAGAVAGVLGQSRFDQGVRAGTFVAVASVLAICALILKAKKFYNDFLYIVLAVLSGILAALGGGLAGLIIPAYMTTKEPK